MKSKYVIIEVEGMEVPLIFSRLLSHEIVAMALRNSVYSAGYCELDASGKWTTSGQSVSLQLNSRPQDADILNVEFGARAEVHKERFGQLNQR